MGRERADCIDKMEESPRQRKARKQSGLARTYTLGSFQKQGVVPILGI